jgi:polygalacturonase
MNKKYFSRRDALRLGGTAAAATILLPSLTSFSFTSKNAPVREFNVLKFGAKGDGKTLDSLAIQKTIDKAASVGKGARVLIPGGHKFLIGTLELKSGIDFHLADDAELIISTDPAHYTGKNVIMANNAVGLKISGTGNLEGKALEFMTHYDKEDEWWIFKDWRPKMYVLTGCKDLQIIGTSFSNAPEWGLHMLGCENVLIDGMKIRNNLEVPNCDGIDPDHCRNVEIKNCDIVCGDDAIVVKATRQDVDYGPSANIHVYDCVMETQDSGLKIGTETTSDIYDIVFERCKIKSSCRGLTIQLRDNARVYNVDFRDIEFVSRYHSKPWWGRGEAISFTAIPRLPETKLGEIFDIRVKNITGKSENSVRINGTKESRIKNISMEKVAITMDRWTKYPGGLFDNRPTRVYEGIEMHNNPGYSIRYADNVQLNKCTINWGENKPEYFCNALEAENVTGLKLSQFKGEAAHPDKFDDIVIR